MKSTFLKIVAGIAIAYSCRGQEVNCSIKEMNEDLIARYERDQEIRLEIMPLIGAYQKDGSGKMKLVMKALKMEKIDKENQEALVNYLEQCGWPSELSPKAHQAIYIILQHAEDSLMRANFPLVEERVKEQILAPDDWATMYDRLRMNAGKHQRFGTQTFAGADNINWIWPVENVEDLQSRRDSVFLPSMDTYFKLALDSTGVEMKWDKTMTLKQALEMKNSSGF